MMHIQTYTRIEIFYFSFLFSFKSSGTPRSHTALAGSGKIVYTFGNPTLIGTAKWASAKQKKIDVKQLLRHKGATLDEPKSNYMYDCLRERCDIAADRIFHIGKDLCKKVFGANADDYELSQVDEHSQVGGLVEFEKRRKE